MKPQESYCNICTMAGFRPIPNRVNCATLPIPSGLRNSALGGRGFLHLDPARKLPWARNHVWFGMMTLICKPATDRQGDDPIQRSMSLCDMRLLLVVVPCNSGSPKLHHIAIPAPGTTTRIQTPMTAMSRLVREGQFTNGPSA
jgi:hypothetical protein